MLGTISKIWRNEREDGSHYWVLSIDGERYSAFEADLVKHLNEGDFVEFTYTQSGKYRNLVCIKPVSRFGFGACDGPSVPPEAIRILRMNCLRTAAEVLKGSSLRPEQRASAALEIAEKLEGHVLRPDAVVPCACREEQTEEDGEEDHD